MSSNMSGLSTHTAVTVRDLDQSVDFYSRYFGFVPMFEADLIYDEPWFEAGVVAGARARSMMLSRGSTVLELFEYESPSGNEIEVPDLTHVAASHLGIEVDDIERVWNELRDAGLQPNSWPITNEGGKHVGSRWFYCREPNGWFIEVYQKPEDSTAGGG